MPTVHAFHVVPALPDSLDRLRTLAFNIQWAWNHETIELFRSLDRELWESSGHNPVLMLGTISQERLREAAQDDSFLGELDRVCFSLENYMRANSTWYKRNYEDKVPDETRIAYFSMEFGLTECLPIYSGGLGVLAGDHLKSSSDLGIPLVGIGLLYQQGYFRQYLNADGWQQERYPNNDFYNMPMQLQTDASGQPVRICVEFPGRNVYAQVWKVQVGRVPLYLLDTNISDNRYDDQNVSNQLYGGDNEQRLKQEMILGIGGMRMLAALGIQPTVCHMNEGHSAFLAFERTRMLMQQHQCDYWHAREATAAGSLFTTHTPVPAGFDMFPADLLHRYFGPYISQLGLSFDDFMNLGRYHDYNTNEKFNMAIMALRHAHYVNGVSKLHGKVTRRMVQVGFQNFPETEVPVQSVTNGVHTRSFVSREMADLLDRYLGGRWSQDVSGGGVWDKVNDIPEEDLWRIRQRRREQLVLFARDRLKAQYEQRGMSEYEIRQAREILHPDALTIGFARRFATYKRAALLLSDADRLIRLLTNEKRPVQILMAGKAHPRDDGGKDLIRQIVHFASRPEVRNRIVFLEDYDIGLARHLVQGVDVWLNTPRRPMEASGTSGMKVLANGGLNLSIPDGWWAEGYDPRVGWSIGHGEEYADPDDQDRIESRVLYDILEKEVVPLFYDRAGEGIPRAWLARVKNSMRLLCPIFNTHRMVSEYATRFYFPATERYERLTQDNLALARELVDWKNRVREAWGSVRIERVETQKLGEKATISSGTALHVAAYIQVGALTPSDVHVQAYYGSLDSEHQVSEGTPINLAWTHAEGVLNVYEGDIPTTTSGIQGFSVRVLPAHPNAELPIELPLVTWGVTVCQSLFLAADGAGPSAAEAAVTKREIANEEPVMPRKAKADATPTKDDQEAGPNALAEKKQQLLDLTGAFCDAHLNADYKRLCKKIIDQMARKKPAPFLRGRLEIWAAGILHALGTVNFLFDKSFKPYVSAPDIAAFFQVSPNSASQKATAVRTMFNLTYFSTDFMTKQMQEKMAPTFSMLEEMETILGDDIVLPESDADTIEEGRFIARDSPVQARFYDLAQRYDPQRITPAFEQSVRKLIELDPDFYDAYLMLRDILIARGQTGEAAQLLQTAYERALARVTDAKGEWPPALEWGWLENRHIIRTFLNKALEDWTAGRTDAALDLLRKLLRANPGDNIGARDYILAIRMGMTFEGFEKQFTSQFGYDGTKMMEWFDKNIKRFPEEFDWWKQAVEYEED